MDNIRLIFVLPDKYSNEKEASEIMLKAYEVCKQNVKSDVTWVKENDFHSLTLNKSDFVVFEDFKGEVFDTSKASKCARILGPCAISICLMEGKAIPNFPWPIYNVAMYECVVTCSNLPKNKKLDIKERVQTMGGCYVDTLVEKVTHLVTDNPKSEKYLAAAEAGVKLMCSTWIEAVWESSQSANIHATDEEFDVHKCLPFQNLNISCTGLVDTKRKELMKLVKENGGKYSAKLNLAEADVLVCAGTDGCMSEKYKAARKRSNIKCVDVSWITESVAKGYALPHHLHQVRATSTSTPTKSNAQLNPDFSTLSAISVANISGRVCVDATFDCSPNLSRPGQSKRKDYARLVDTLDVKKAKKAGQYLDGCSVYITGFNAEHAEKLYKILNLSGATRYDQFSERVTHVIVGDPNCHEVKVIKSKSSRCVLVSVQWLLDSIENEQPVNEENYILSTSDADKSDFGSPLSKKGLNLLRTDKTVTEMEVGEVQSVEHEPEPDIIRQYLPASTVQEEEDTVAQLLRDAQNLPEFSNQAQESSTQQSSTGVTQDATSECDTESFFDGKKFLVVGFEDNHLAYVKELIEGFSGELVPKSYKGIPDFIVTPVFSAPDLRHTAAEVVNDLFINECAKEGELLTDICYYHRPFDLPDTNPLVNCVVTISGYSSYERNFLKMLIEALGGQHQEQFARVTSEAKGVLRSTHLVSDKASGKKYLAAVKWGVPVVDKDWLMEVAKRGARMERDCESGAENGGKDDTLQPRTVIGEAQGSYSNTPDGGSMSNLSCLEKFATPSCAGVVKAATSTPRNAAEDLRKAVLTPLNQRFPRKLSLNDSTDKPFSQATPVNKIVQQYRESNASNTPCNSTPEKFLWMGIKTPETPLGACIHANPSPQLRKECEFWLKQFPDFESPVARRLSTPLSEIKRQLWNKILKKGEESQSEQTSPRGEDAEDEAEMDVEEPKEPVAEDSTQNRLINSRLQQLEEMVNASGGGKRQSRNFQSTIPIPEGNKEYKDSQVCTVGWDFRDQEVAPKPARIFILSGIGDSARASMVVQLESLGATVSDLSSYDPSSTHLLCPKPARNEKTLACMAAGKWILHTSYLEKCLEAGRFLDEEEFEFGNPKSVGKFAMHFESDVEAKMRSVHWWRKEVARRGYGAFNDMRAIVVAQKREPIVRVIEAGGGIVVDVRPPFDDTVHATHALLEQRSVRDYAEYVPLAQQGVYLLNTLYISDYLYQPHKDVRECVLPYFTKYYSRS